MKKWCILATPETREYIVRWAKSFFHYSGVISGNWKYFYSENVYDICSPKFYSERYCKEYPLISFEEFKLLTSLTNTINNYEIY